MGLSLFEGALNLAFNNVQSVFRLEQPFSSYRALKLVVLIALVDQSGDLYRLQIKELYVYTMYITVYRLQIKELYVYTMYITVCIGVSHHT